mgnify:CR=1 FL=1
MTKNEEDLLFSIHEEIEKDNLRKKFDKQLKKMKSQEKHKYKNVCEKWEYAFNKIKK